MRALRSSITALALVRRSRDWASTCARADRSRSASAALSSGPPWDTASDAASPADMLIEADSSSVIRDCICSITAVNATAKGARARGERRSTRSSGRARKAKDSSANEQRHFHKDHHTLGLEKARLLGSLCVSHLRANVFQLRRQRLMSRAIFSLWGKKPIFSTINPPKPHKPQERSPDFRPEARRAQAIHLPRRRRLLPPTHSPCRRHLGWRPRRRRRHCAVTQSPRRVAPPEPRDHRSRSESCPGALS